MKVRTWSHFAQDRCAARQHVDIIYREIGAGLIGNGEEMKNSICRPPHSDVKGHGIEHGLTRGNRARKHRVIAVTIITPCVFNNLTGRTVEERKTLTRCGENRTVARQREPDSLVERVHRICGEHA